MYSDRYMKYLEKVSNKKTIKIRGNMAVLKLRKTKYKDSKSRKINVVTLCLIVLINVLLPSTLYATPVRNPFYIEEKPEYQNGLSTDTIDKSFEEYRKAEKALDDAWKKRFDTFLLDYKKMFLTLYNLLKATHNTIKAENWTLFIEHEAIHLETKNYKLSYYPAQSNYLYIGLNRETDNVAQLVPDIIARVNTETEDYLKNLNKDMQQFKEDTQKILNGAFLTTD